MCYKDMYSYYSTYIRHCYTKHTYLNQCWALLESTLQTCHWMLDGILCRGIYRTDLKCYHVLLIEHFRKLVSAWCSIWTVFLKLELVKDVPHLLLIHVRIQCIHQYVHDSYVDEWVWLLVLKCYM